MSPSFNIAYIVKSVSWTKCYILLAQLCVFTSSNPYTDSTRTLNRLFDPERYDKRLRPFLKGPPLNVTVDMTIVSIAEINALTMDFSLDLFFRQEWNDPRLVHNLSSPLIFGEDLKSSLWIPDTFFRNVRTAKLHSVPSHNSRFLVKQNGDIGYSTRITLTASCLMDFKNYPMDTQLCGLEMESYSFDVNNMDYFWKNLKELNVIKKEMPEFEVLSLKKDKDVSVYATGQFINLSVIFKFRRRIGYSLLQIYAPTFLIVALSWLSFWISKEAVPARVALGVTTVLTIVTLMASFRQHVPRVSYIKALDWYLIVSFFLVFGSVLEYVAVILQYDIKSSKTKEAHLTNADSMELQQINEDKQLAQNNKQEARKSPSIWIRANASIKPRLPIFLRTEASVIDRASRILFPLTYFVFNIIYWSIYFSNRHLDDNNNRKINFH